MPKPKPIKPEKYAANDISSAIRDFIIPHIATENYEYTNPTTFQIMLINGQSFIIEVREV